LFNNQFYFSNVLTNRYIQFAFPANEERVSLPMPAPQMQPGSYRQSPFEKQARYATQGSRPGPVLSACPLFTAPAPTYLPQLDFNRRTALRQKAASRG
jgi:hypothetical protein